MKRPPFHPLTLITLTWLTLTITGLNMRAASDWNQFRGPNGSGSAPHAKPPIQLDAAHTAWNTPLPQGHASPIWADGHLIVTGKEHDQLVTLALDAKDGKVLWKAKAPSAPFEKVHQANHHASSTPCSDGRHHFVYFGSYGLLCYDREGTLQWKQPIQTPKSLYGMSTSPILYRDFVILVLDDDRNMPGSELSQSKIIALHKSTGETAWETSRPYQRSNWSTPMIWDHDQGQDLVVLGNGRLYAYAPATGEEKWYVNGFARETIAIPVAGDGKLFASASMQGGWGDTEPDPGPFWNAVMQFDTNGDGQLAKSEISDTFTIPIRPELPIDNPGFGIPLPTDPEKRKQRQMQFFDWRDQNKDGVWTREEYMADMIIGRGRPNLAAILPGGEGDVTTSKAAWNLRRGIPEIPSPVYHQKRLYLVRDGGIFTCVDATNGKIIYRERLNASGQYAASPIVANQHIYCFSNLGWATVIPAGDTFGIASQHDLDTKITATPAIQGDTLYVRTASGLRAFTNPAQ